MFESSSAARWGKKLARLRMGLGLSSRAKLSIVFASKERANSLSFEAIDILVVASVPRTFPQLILVYFLSFSDAENFFRDGSSFVFVLARVAIHLMCTK